MQINRRIKQYKNVFKNQGCLAVINRFIVNALNKINILFMKLFLSHKEMSNCIIFESQNDFDANCGAFYEYLISNKYNEKYKIVWLIKNYPPKNLPKNVLCFNLNRPSLKKAYYLYIAKYYILDFNLFKKARKNQVSIYLTHGSFSLKSFKGLTAFPQDLNYYLVSSANTAAIYAEQYMLPYPNTKQVILGFPKHDVLYSKELGDLHKLTSDKYHKVILWMPTFRKAIVRNDSYSEQPLGIPIFKSMDELKLINTILNENHSLLIIKIHPAQDLNSTKVVSLSNIKVINGETVKKMNLNVNKLMKDVDALISDYSSSAYDFLHIDRPIAYTFDDINDYKLGLKVSEPSKWMAGPIINNTYDFQNFICNIINNDDKYKEERQALLKKVFKYHDGDSSKRLAEFLML